jgi:hypothetical protein
MSSMYIHISGWQTFNFEALSSLTVIGWPRWSSGLRWRPSSWRSSCACVPLACLWILAIPCWQRRKPSVSFSQTIARWHSIAVFNLLCPGNTTPPVVFSRALVPGFLISWCISPITACDHPPVAMLPIFKARCMSDCSSCTRPPCLAIVAVMLKTYKKSVAALKMRSSYYLNHIQLRSLLWDL